MLPGAPGAKGPRVGDKSKRAPQNLPAGRKGGAPPKTNSKTDSKTQPNALQPSIAAANAVSPVAPAEAKPADDAAKSDEPKVMDDWWLVRDQRGHAGWVLARMIDIDVPMEIAQYAEGQRIQACFVLNRVQDEGKDVPQYLVVMNEPKDGSPFDFNSFRIFTWNTHRHRYETAYRERNIMGFLPVTIGNRNFDKEGVQPIFTVKLRNEDGTTSDHTFRLAGPLVKRVLAPEEEAKKAALIQKTPKKKAVAHKRHSR